MSRGKKRPKPLVVVAPLVVTDQNCMHVAGVDPRQFRTLLELLDVPHTRTGHRVLVRSDVLLDALARAERRDAPPSAGADDSDAEEQPQNSADVLSRLGLRRVG